MSLASKANQTNASCEALVLSHDAAHYQALLQQASLPGLRLHYAASIAEAESISTLAQCQIVLGQPDLSAVLLPQLPQLQWLQSTYAGVDALCRPGLRTDYQLSSVKGVFGPLMSEYVFAYVLGLERQVFQARTLQQQACWDWQALAYRRLADLHLGIAGLGDIGQHIAATAKHFGMQVSGLKRQRSEVAQVDAVYDNSQVAEFLAPLDYLVLVLPDTPHTQHFLNSDTLAMLKPEAVVINVGRGAAIDTDALVQALQQQRLRAAVLDVFEQEPLPTEHPLWPQPNAYITPHNAARSFPDDVVQLFVSNYQRFVAGEPLLYLVDFSQGY